MKGADSMLMRAKGCASRTLTDTTLLYNTQGYLRIRPRRTCRRSTDSFRT